MYQYAGMNQSCLHSIAKCVVFVRAVLKERKTNNSEDESFSFEGFLQISQVIISK